MLMFVLGAVLAALVAATYVALGARDFMRIRRELGRVRAAEPSGGEPAALPAAVEDPPLDAGRETVGFAWRAVGGVAASVAFVVDPTRVSGRGSP